jgi:hypothetical protein
VYTQVKFTTSKEGTNIKYGGRLWEGINWLNELYELVEKNRDEPWAEMVEEQIQQEDIS